MGGSESKTAKCYITKDGEHVSHEDVVRAGASNARLQDDEGASPIADSLYLLFDKTNWNAVPENIEKPCDEH